MGIRHNIVTNAAARDAYVDGVMALKSDDAGVSTTDLGIPDRPGQTAQDLSTYDLFVLWHVRAMNERTPAGSDRNAAHRGPTFLPWHRWLMLLLEFQFQRVLGDANFGLPYWDWAADGDRPVNQQPNRPIWAADAMGGNGTGVNNSVSTGRFGSSGAFRVRIESDGSGQMWATNRPLRRSFGSASGLGLPTKSELSSAMSQPNYDESNWNTASDGMRNHVEGWTPFHPSSMTHNRVHVWIGGDMGPGSSPNDPVFYMNHCNVDRIWAAWQDRNPTRPYRPPQSASTALFRHRRNDPLYSLLTTIEPTPGQMLNVSSFYTYDSLAVD